MDCVDEYGHLNSKIMYFPQSIPTGEVEETIELSRVWCKCKEVCKEPNCVCIKQSGTHYSFTAIEDLENYVLTEKNVKRPTYECNEQCACKNRLCGNKLAQCGPRKGLKIKMCDNTRKGEGLFTENPIKSGNFICEYAGELISEPEAMARYKTNTELSHMNYIFAIDEYFGETNIKTFIDPTFYGNIGRYGNHSCDPNCTMEILRINNNIPVLGLFACKDIKEGEELSYDYGTSFSKECKEESLNRIKCLCESEVCRGFLPFDARFT